MNSRPEANSSALIPRERTSRFMARQTDSSSSTIAISGLDLLKGNALRAPGRPVKKFHMLRCAQSLCFTKAVWTRQSFKASQHAPLRPFSASCYGINLEEFEESVYWTLVQ